MSPSRFSLLGSSSSGNSGFLATDHAKVLIDLGFSGRRTSKFLREMGTSIDEIEAIFLTHEHSDHSYGLNGLAKHPQIPVYANRDTARAIQAKLNWRPNWKIFETGTTFVFKDLKVSSFSVPHDAYDPVGFTFTWGYDDLFSPRRSLAWATDMGYIPEAVKEHLRGVDTLVIEANYDEDLLENDLKRPWSVKQRIRGRHGHLSNQDIIRLFREIEQPLWKQVFLVHLSRDCNCKDHVKNIFSTIADYSRQFELSIIDPEEFCPKPIFF
ncbi:MAG: MBL fold metallo-hydrolase [Verrucomicrobiota bacterium]